MFKMIFFLTKKDGMPYQDFVDYYENHHRKMIKQIPNVSHYVRRYIKPPPQMTDKPTSFDVITEVWFETEEAYQDAVAQTSSREFRKMIADDEENFLDRSKTRVACVDERVG